MNRISNAATEPPQIYLVTDTELCGGRAGLTKTVAEAASAGLDFVQLRDHHATTRELTDMAKDLLEVLEDGGIPLIIDDRLDVALAIGAAGVHLGQSDLDPVLARRVADEVAGPQFHIGWSISNLTQAAAAARLPNGTIDLLGIGPYRATPTKPDAAEPLSLAGVEQLADAAWSASLPCVAIGGVKKDDVRPLLAAGVTGVAVVSAICGQPDPAEAVRGLRAEIQHFFEAHREHSYDRKQADHG